MRLWSDVADSLGNRLSVKSAFLAGMYSRLTFYCVLVSGLFMVMVLTGLNGLYTERNALALRRLTSGFSV